MTIPKLVLSSPADVLAAVPYLVGFHPADSLVVIGLAGPEVRLTTRWDLPAAPGDLDRLVPLLCRESVTAVFVVGYGSGGLVTPAVDTVTRLLRARGIRVAESLRAEGGRYWSYACGSATCCPAEGTPYDTERSPIAAQAVMHGLVALPDRDSLRRSVGRRGGAAMREATLRVMADLRAVWGPGGPAADEPAARFVAEGLARVRGAIGVYDAGGRLDDDAAARLGLDLAVIRVRDEAWALIDDRDAHIALWRDLTRRLEPGHVAPAASLLAAAAWHRGECALAGIALERALAADPGYSMALLLREALAHMLSPALLRDRMPTPEELDDEMGPPRAAWLAPLHALLAQDPADPAGTVDAASTAVPKAGTGGMAEPAREAGAGGAASEPMPETASRTAPEGVTEAASSRTPAAETGAGGAASRRTRAAETGTGGTSKRAPEVVPEVAPRGRARSAAGGPQSRSPS
ncbi:hypothetical protein GCM10010116_08180 [Microbispora rosea subsp. aerata]|nr:DUF4192 domain-containing protein [Microbispora rosea]GGO04142.1 hypothetical protein GCM10010116_08180 [Microbispora rosea subsp. aerata]GIH54949.1 hypothetical protein Mro02_18630 [Microbispora rosea subsp. aerata]GLJ82963.1 hypothetical protein GCM10017588_16890 [Microbispora rosea subsp. aerata]